MRTTSLAALIGLSVALSACTEDEPDEKDTVEPGPVVTTPTGDTGTDGPDYIDVVAVGFEYFGVILDNGDTSGWTGSDGGAVDQLMVLTFANEDFFGAGGTDEDSCEAVAFFEASAKVSPDQIPTHDGAVLYQSYEVALDLNPANSDCAGRVDPKVWGAQAEGLLDPFVGARLGYGFGPMTEYLLKPFREAWSEEDFEEAKKGMLASYVALNDKDGNWIGIDWTTGRAWQFDTKTDMPVVDDEGFLSLMDLEALNLAPGTRLPTTYIQSNARWYQDFPLLDLTNLTDGAPAAAP